MGYTHTHTQTDYILDDDRQRDEYNFYFRINKKEKRTRTSVKNIFVRNLKRNFCCELASASHLAIYPAHQVARHFGQFLPLGCKQSVQLPMQTQARIPACHIRCQLKAMAGKGIILSIKIIYRKVLVYNVCCLIVFFFTFQSSRKGAGFRFSFQYLLDKEKGCQSSLFFLSRTLCSSVIWVRLLYFF